MNSSLRKLVALGALLVGIALALGAWYFWSSGSVPVVSEPTPPTATGSVPVPDVAPAVAAAASAPPTAVDLPIDKPALTGDSIGAGLDELLGRTAVLRFLQPEDFARRVVATVDNLGRERASSRLWPVIPTEGRFTVQQQDGAAVMAPDNEQRYAAMVQLLESVDSQRALDLYARMYPLLQETYEGIGYPRQSFNNRLIAVIDLLLATPQTNPPVKLTLLDIKGPLESERPWVRYRYADPALESLTAGQKIMIRMGPTNERRVKAKLQELRAGLVERSRPAR